MTPTQREALTKAEATFRRYGDLHAAKPDPVKAAANYEMADRMAAALAEVVEPVAIRGNFDGFGYDYVDNGHGSSWLDRHPDWERLYTAPRRAVKLSDSEVEALVADPEIETMDALYRAIEAAVWAKLGATE